MKKTNVIDEWKKRLESIPALHELDEASKRKKETRKRKKQRKKIPKAPKGQRYGFKNTSSRYDCLLHGKNFPWKESCWGCKHFLEDL